VEEQFVSLEMARSEVEQGQAELRKQLDGLKLEVNRLNWFLERENMSNPQDKAGIFGAGDVGTSSSAEGATHGQRGLDLPPHAYGMHTSDPFRGEHSRPHQQNHHGEGGCMGYGCHPKLQFPISSGEDPQLWRSQCENYFDMYQLESSLWCAWPLCTWKDQQHVGFNRLNANSSMPVGMSFAG
jgi:hypothetical protein